MKETELKDVQEHFIPKKQDKSKHNSHSQQSLKKLYIASAICFLFLVAEIIGGILANSIAIMSDAAHMLSDLTAFLISIFSVCLVKKPASTNFTYGYHRAEIIGAVISVALIWGLTIWLVYEGVDRILNPGNVEGEIMLITAIVGLICNIVMAFALHGHSHSHSHHSHKHGKNPKIQKKEGEDGYDLIQHQENVNIRAAFLHVVGDFIESIGVTIAAIIIMVEPEWEIADPICTFLFSIIVLFTTGPIIKECVLVLMEGTPLGVDIDMLSEDLANVKVIEIEEVVELHDLHVWSLSIGKSSMSCHFVSKDPPTTLKMATKICKEKYGIAHITIQIEDLTGAVSFDCCNELH